MQKSTIGIIHPGAMGISVAATIRNSDHTVCWASVGRSAATHARAESQDLEDVGTLMEMARRCDVIICVCPPASAETVADDVIAANFTGLYIDANAISPQKATRIATKLAAANIPFVDGSIIGPPAWEPNRTWLALSGTDAQRAADLFAAGPLETDVISDQIGDASALKMCFAAQTKGATALLALVMAAAEQHGVRDALERQWNRYDPQQPDQNQQRARRVTAKAWRFEGEMWEMVETFNALGLPDGFHRASAEIYHRLAHFKDAPETPALEDVLTSLNSKSG